MLLSLLIVASVLASPPTSTLLDEFPKRTLLLALPSSDTRSLRRMTVFRVADTHTAQPDGLWSWVDQLAVVRPHHQDRRGPSLQMFVSVGFVKGQVSLRAFGSF